MARIVFTRALLMAAVALVLASCGDQGLASRGYLSKSATEVAFIQLTVTGTTLSGAIDVADLNGSNLNTQHASFTGAESGQSVTLIFGRGFEAITNISGAVTADALVLNFPQSSGAIQGTTFSPADTGTYNSALLQLQQRASHAQSVEAAAAQQAQLDSAVTSAASQTQSAMAALQGNSVGSTTIVADLQSQQKDLANMRSDEVNTRADDQLSQCADAGGVQADAGGVAADAGGLHADQANAMVTVSSLQLNITTVNSDLSALQAAEQADSSYRGSVPTQDEVSAAIAPAQTSINSILATANSAVAQADSVSASAHAEATAFAKQYCG